MFINKLRTLNTGASRVRFVRMKGLEPPRLTAPDPKSGAAANYATSAAIMIGKSPTPDLNLVRLPAVLVTVGKAGCQLRHPDLFGTDS
jgi:hypothetical protein